MLSYCTKLVLIIVFLAVNIPRTLQCPGAHTQDVKAAYKSGEMSDLSTPITLEKVKMRLKESGVFNPDDDFTDREKKELAKLFDAVEIMLTSRNRQPQNVQNMFSSLRLVERVVKKQLKEGQISETLAAKFHWEKLSTRQKRSKPAYVVDSATNMRVFDTNA